MLNLGAVIKKTPLTEQFDWDDFREEYAECKVVLTMAKRGGEALISTVDRPLAPQSGWSVISMSWSRIRTGTVHRARATCDPSARSS